MFKNFQKQTFLSASISINYVVGGSGPPLLLLHGNDTTNKMTVEVGCKLENVIDGLINSIQIEELNNNQKLKMLQIALQ